MHYYYYRAEESIGPVSFEELQTLVEQGLLTEEDSIWQSEETGWIPAAQLDGLFPSEATDSKHAEHPTEAEQQEENQTLQATPSSKERGSARPTLMIAGLAFLIIGGLTVWFLFPKHTAKAEGTTTDLQTEQKAHSAKPHEPNEVALKDTPKPIARPEGKRIASDGEAKNRSKQIKVSKPEPTASLDTAKEAPFPAGDFGSIAIMHEQDIVSQPGHIAVCISDHGDFYPAYQDSRFKYFKVSLDVACTTKSIIKYNARQPPDYFGQFTYLKPIEAGASPPFRPFKITDFSQVSVGDKVYLPYLDPSGAFAYHQAAISEIKLRHNTARPKTITIYGDLPSGLGAPVIHQNGTLIGRLSEYPRGSDFYRVSVIETPIEFWKTKPEFRFTLPATSASNANQTITVEAHCNLPYDSPDFPALSLQTNKGESANFINDGKSCTATFTPVPDTADRLEYLLKIRTDKAAYKGTVTLDYLLTDGQIIHPDLIKNIRQYRSDKNKPETNTVSIHFWNNETYLCDDSDFPESLLMTLENGSEQDIPFSDISIIEMPKPKWLTLQIFSDGESVLGNYIKTYSIFPYTDATINLDNYGTFPLPDKQVDCSSRLQTLELPAVVCEHDFAGNGRYLIVSLRTIGRLLCVDVLSGEIISEFKASPFSSLLKTGKSFAYFFEEKTNTINILSLPDLQLISTVKLKAHEKVLSLAPVKSHDMFCMSVISETNSENTNSDKKKIYLINPKNAERMEVECSFTDAGILVSPDGKNVFLGKAERYQRVEEVDEEWSSFNGRSQGHFSPVFLGSQNCILSQNKLYAISGEVLRGLTPDFRFHSKDELILFPDQESSSYIGIDPIRYRVFTGIIGSESPSLELVNHGLSLPKEKSELPAHAIYPIFTHSRIVNIPPDSSRIQLLSIAPIDELLAMKDSPPIIESPLDCIGIIGEPYQSSLEIHSADDEVTFKVLHGPEGFLISPEGKLLWKKVEGVSGSSIPIAIEATNSNDRKKLYKMRLVIREKEIAQ